MSLLPPVSPTELIVCTTCRPAGAARAEPAAGALLFEAVSALASPEGVRVRGLACMSACSRACTVALQAPGKHSYLFGDLAPDEATARDVLACAALHAAAEDGTLMRNARPERLRSGILARLPAPAQESEA